MVQHLIDFLGQLKLTLTQWALLTCAALLAVLAVLLRFKSLQLKRAQVQLMGMHYSNEIGNLTNQLDKTMDRRKESKARYEKTLRAYLDLKSRS